MKEVFEALERLKNGCMGGNEYRRYLQSDAAITEDYEIVKQFILELKAIKQANPTEALDDFEKMTQQIFQVDSSFEMYAEKVKQHLLKAQELEKENTECKRLEKKIDCPLEIILKIMLKEINTIFVIYGDGGYNSPYDNITPASVSGLYDMKNYLELESEWVIETNLCPVPLKDYKVSWWIKEDRSE